MFKNLSDYIKVAVNTYNSDPEYCVFMMFARMHGVHSDEDILDLMKKVKPTLYERLFDNIQKPEEGTQG